MGLTSVDKPVDLPEPFAALAALHMPRTALRQRITAAKLRPEAECIVDLIEAATLPPELAQAVQQTATRLIVALRTKPRTFGVQSLMQEYALSSQEGIALMCLAEALLRIPDTETRDALIREKAANGDWRAHLGADRPLFVNAATWGLMVTGVLLGGDRRGPSAALARCGEPVIRKAMDLMMRLLGKQFVCGETISAALANSRALQAKGFRYSYDMLGEAAMTSEDALRYHASYADAIHAIGSAAGGCNVYERPGISIKLSALHPRYSHAQAARVFDTLLPRLRALARLARRYDVGLNIDAEESDRLELSLDLLELLAADDELAGWHGLGFVVQAYDKRCPAVIDYLIDLARRSGRRLMLRLVKGAYWDSEIKRAQVDGLKDFPVYTRKVHTDVAYLACARTLLAQRTYIFPQFATHNAQTLATIHAMAGDHFSVGDYEFQCLHGMGEPLYAEVVGPGKLTRPCRIYAPVGTYETLLAYLVRRLLENGANTSFVSRIADTQVTTAELVADPAVRARATSLTPHPAIARAADLFSPTRRNSEGIDLTDELRLDELSQALRASAVAQMWAAPSGASRGGSRGRPVLNPADHRDIVGHVVAATAADVQDAIAIAARATIRWGAVPVAARAAHLMRAADLMQARMPNLLGLLVREAGKTVPNAIAEVREAIDFLRYYAGESIRVFDPAQTPLGPVACISPWNFPLAIFTGQIAAALAAGNAVLAKPAEETPLIAAQAVALLHEVGVPEDALQVLPGDGSVGAALVAHGAVCGVMFTGSTEVAHLIERELAGRQLPSGAPIPLIAETGGQNAMLVDSSALPEQVVADLIASAFDSAGQRCSSLRVLCLQEEVADRILAMLKGAMHELVIGPPDRLATDIGPVISRRAKEAIDRHIVTMRRGKRSVVQLALPPECQHGTFVAPTLIEINSIAELAGEVFGPVLHVMRYARGELDRVIDDINGTGFGLTFGLHTRLDDTVDHVLARIRAGNIYVNRNIIGAVVGTQPFGGHGLSGTGPKAGGPFYVSRLVTGARDDVPCGTTASPSLTDLIEWLKAQGRHAVADRCSAMAVRSMIGHSIELPGPVGERNIYSLHPRGCVLLVAQTPTGLLLQIGAALATGNTVAVEPSAWGDTLLGGLPTRTMNAVRFRPDGLVDAALIEGGSDQVATAVQRLVSRNSALAPMQCLSTTALASTDYRLDWLVAERTISINTAATGGNVTLMTIG